MKGLMLAIELVTDKERKVQLQEILRAAYADVDARRAQTPEQLIDGAGRPVTGHAAIDNIPNLGAIVFVFWNPDRGIRMQGEYEENPDGTLKDLVNFPGGRGSSVFQACQNMMLSASGCASARSRSSYTCRRACSSKARCSWGTATSH